MKLPEEILIKLEEMAKGKSKKNIAKNFRKISDRYMGEKTGESLLNIEDEAIAYAISRMPATYGAVYTACKQFAQTVKCVSSMPKCETMIDVGAGTGAATLAINEFFSFKKVTCIEREDVMSDIGMTLFKESSKEEIKNANWIKLDLNDLDINTLSEKADIVITSYMLNEFSNEKVIEIVDKLWNLTNKFLIIVDPGTPEDYNRLIRIKDYLNTKGANVIAPCTSNNGCGLPQNDWCNFSCRIERSKLQKEVKAGEVPYEDEKFTYLIMSKNSLNIKDAEISRIIRHPIINKNTIKVKLCSNGGVIERIYTKKEKEIYKKVKKAQIGEII